MNSALNNGKAGADMNAQLNFNKDQLKEQGIVSENCNCSVYSMITVAGGVLLALGTVIYSLIAM